MIEVPLDPAAERVLDEVTGSDESVIVELLGTRLKAEPAGMVAHVVSGLDLPTSPIAIDRAVLSEQANREAELHGDTPGRAVVTARAEFRRPRADRAFAQHEEVMPFTGPLSVLMPTAAVARRLHPGMSAIIDVTGHTRAERGRWPSLTDRSPEVNRRRVLDLVPEEER